MSNRTDISEYVPITGRTLRDIRPDAHDYIFVVIRANGRESPQIWFDDFKESREPGAPFVVWKYRLDKARDLDFTMMEHWNMYCLLKREGKLPPSNMADTQSMEAQL